MIRGVVTRRRVACTVGSLLVVLGAARGATVRAQEPYPPVRAMGLPDTGFNPPDPTPLRLQLDGGLTAYVVPDPLVPLVRFTALVGAGYADGPGGGPYAASLRAGPASMAPGAFATALRDMVADFGISQSATETAITLEVPNEDAGQALALLTGLLRESPAGDGADVPHVSASESAAAESGPVLYEGSLDAAVRLLRERIFTPHAGAESYAGPADAAAFHRRYVVPGNVVLAVGGDLDATVMRERLAASLADWTGVAPALATHGSPPPAPRRGLLTYPAAKLQGWGALGHELPAVPLEDEAPLLVMNYILGGGHFDTRLFRATRDRRGLTNDDSGFPELGFRGPGLYSFRTYGRPEAVRLLIHLTLQEIERIRVEPVTEEELFVAQGALADGDTSLWFRNGAATATTYAREWLRYRDHARTASWQQRVRTVTSDEVLDAARRYLHPERMQIVVVGPIDAIRAAPTLEDEPALASYR